MRATYDFSPLYRSFIGADRMAGLVESALRGAEGRDYPPYDVEKTSDDSYRITLAVAGFSADDLEISAEPNLLVVRGRKADQPATRAFLHQGLAMRPFEQRFELADHVWVTDARHTDGLLTIDLVRQIPEALKPRRIEINSSRLTPVNGQPDRERQTAAAA